MALPKAVQAIGDAAEAAAVEAGMTPGSKPATPQTPVSAVPAEPAPAEPKIDPDNYKERFARYKESTDVTISELRQTLAQTQTTLAEIQRQNQELITKLTSTPTAPAPSTPSAEDVEEAGFQAWLGKLSKKIRDDYEENFLRDQYAIQMATAVEQKADPKPDNELNELKETVSQLKQVAEKTDAQLYEEAMDEAYPKDAWIKMTQEQEWGPFCAKQVSPVDQRTYGDIVEQGNKTHVANTVIWVLKQYEQHLSELEAASKGTIEQDPLTSQLTPEGAGGGGSDPITAINAQAETFTQSQVTQFFNDVATTKKYSAEQAAAIEKQIIAAQAAGKIVPG